MKKRLVVSVWSIALTLISPLMAAAEALEFYVGYKQVEEGTTEADHFLELGLENEVRTKGFRQIKMTLDQLSAQLDQIIKSEVLKKSPTGIASKTLNGGSSLGSGSVTVSTLVVNAVAGNAKSVISSDPVNLNVEPSKNKKSLQAIPLKVKKKGEDALPAKKVTSKEYPKFNPNFKSKDYTAINPPGKDYEIVAIQVKTPKPVVLKSPEFVSPQELPLVRTHAAASDRSLADEGGVVPSPVTTVIVKESDMTQQQSAQVRDRGNDKAEVSTDSNEQSKRIAKSAGASSVLLKNKESSDKNLPPKDLDKKSDPCIEGEIVDDVFRAMNKLKNNTDHAVFIAAQEYKTDTVSCWASFRNTIKLATSLGCEKGDFSLTYKEWDPINEPMESMMERRKKSHFSVAAWLNSSSNQLQSGNAITFYKTLVNIKKQNAVPEQDLSSFCTYANYLRIVNYTLKFRDEAGIARAKEYEENEKKGKGGAGGILVNPGSTNQSKPKPAAAPATVPKKHPG